MFYSTLLYFVVVLVQTDSPLCLSGVCVFVCVYVTASQDTIAFVVPKACSYLLLLLLLLQQEQVVCATVDAALVIVQ